VRVENIFVVGLVGWLEKLVGGWVGMRYEVEIGVGGLVMLCVLC
jgi:hypothetical protein